MSTCIIHKSRQQATLVVWGPQSILHRFWVVHFVSELDTCIRTVQEMKQKIRTLKRGEWGHRWIGKKQKKNFSNLIFLINLFSPRGLKSGLSVFEFKTWHVCNHTFWAHGGTIYIFSQLVLKNIVVKTLLLPPELLEEMIWKCTKT